VETLCSSFSIRVPLSTTSFYGVSNFLLYSSSLIDADGPLIGTGPNSSNDTTPHLPREPLFTAFHLLYPQVYLEACIGPHTLCPPMSGVFLHKLGLTLT
jgi:hypothetical protein